MNGRRYLPWAAVLLAACGRDAVAPPAPTIVTVALLGEQTLVPEEAVQLTVEARDQLSRVRNPGSVRWWSDDTLVARVDAQGLVTATGIGSARISAVVAGVLGSVMLEVEDGLIVTSLSVGQLHACAATPSGRVVCWGAGGSGQVGPIAGTVAPVPVTVPGLPAVQEVSLGEAHSCARSAGEVFCWGNQWAGRLGNGSATSGQVMTPGPVPAAARFTHLAAGAQHTCATAENGTAWCWGTNGVGQTRTGTTGFAEPRAVPAGVGVPLVRLALDRYPRFGSQFSCGLTGAGALWCWGAIPGDSVRAPHDISAGRTWTRISVDRHVCGLDATGHAWCWGENGVGQVNGIFGTAIDTPVTAFPDRRFREVAVMRNWTCGVSDVSELLCWGSVPRLWPAPFPIGAAPGQEVLDVVLAEDFACFRDTRRYVWCWGSNTTGQLGDGTFTARTAPVRVLAGR